jgi:hypothetical protein
MTSSHLTRLRQNRHHVAAKACIFLFMSVSHCTPSGQAQVWELVIGDNSVMQAMESDESWGQVY